mgnify:CR=1 FL=1
MVLVLLSLIEVSPIKINPWSRLAKIIGHALNAEVLEQQKQTQKKLEEHIQVDDERNANLLMIRYSILIPTGLPTIT